MDISYNTDLGNLNRNVGYGEAGFQIVTALQRLGHRVLFSDPNPPVELWFCQPEYWEFSSLDQYKIGYVPWESSKLPKYWFQHLDQADEIWTTSYQCKKWFEAEGIENVKVYLHGIDHVWSPHKRVLKDKLRFLHVGEPADRKDGQMVVDVFMELFAGKDDVELIIKAQNFNSTRIYDKNKSIIGPPNIIPNIKLIIDDYPTEKLIELFKSCDCLVYPSWGEGFGFIPLQAMATGMPTICTGAWAPYKNYLNDLAIDSTTVWSPWQSMHPGSMFMPNKNDLAEKMLNVYNNFEKYSTMFYDQTSDIHEEYDWETVTSDAFSHIFKKFS